MSPLEFMQRLAARKPRPRPHPPMTASRQSVSAAGCPVWVVRAPSPTCTAAVRLQFSKTAGSDPATTAFAELCIARRNPRATAYKVHQPLGHKSADGGCGSTCDGQRRPAPGTKPKELGALCDGFRTDSRSSSWYEMRGCRRQSPLVFCFADIGTVKRDFRSVAALQILAIAWAIAAVCALPRIGIHRFPWHLYLRSRTLAQQRS
jgi:hypothetical protein